MDLKSNFTHTGIDIAAKKGEKILSPADGLVVFSGITDDLGKTIIISHSNNLFSLYGHNDKNTVNTRTIVNKGDVIGYVGETGNTDGPHLHFELWKNSEVLDLGCGDGSLLASLKNKLNVLQPKDPLVAKSVEVFLTPGLAFTVNGKWLGSGGG